jgi:hypothetical protein
MNWNPFRPHQQYKRPLYRPVFPPPEVDRSLSICRGFGHRDAATAERKQGGSPVLREQTVTSLLPWRNLCCRVGESAHLSSCIYGMELWRAKIRNLPQEPLISDGSQPRVKFPAWTIRWGLLYWSCRKTMIQNLLSRSCKASDTTQLLKLIKIVREERMGE